MQRISLDSFYVGEEINHCWEFVISYYPLVKTADYLKVKYSRLHISKGKSRTLNYYILYVNK